MKKLKVAVLGSGALGTVVGAMLTKSGIDVTLIDGYAEHVKAMKENGATVTGKIQLKVPVKACMLNETQGEFDVVFYMAKAANDPSYLSAIIPHLKTDSVVCTMQNGIPEGPVGKFVGIERVIGGTVSWGGSLIAPGVTEMRTNPENQTYEIGEIDGSISERLKMVKNLLDNAGSCDITDTLVSARWTKMAINVSFSGVSAALGCNWGTILDNEDYLFCAAVANHELLKVAHAKKIKLHSIQGVDFDLVGLPDGKEGLARVKPLYEKFFTTNREVIASMLYDLRQGRNCEIDAINGAIVAAGDELGIETPLNDKIVEIIRQAEATRTIPDETNYNKLFSVLNGYVF